jgi:hypothetical protein
MSVIRSQCKSDEEYLLALRDDFAAKAMQQLVLSVFKQEHVDGIVSASYIIADAMLKERAK